MPSRIVIHAYRPKRPPRKRKAAALAGPALVRKQNKAGAVPLSRAEDRPTPANDDRKPAIVTTTSRKRGKLLRAERAAEPDDDPEATARVRAFLDRMIRPR